MKKYFILGLLVLFLSSCATIGTRPEMFGGDFSVNCSKVSWYPRVYSGARSDILFITDPSAAHARASIYMIFDLPFSLVADTLILPFTIYEQIQYGSYTKGC